MANVLGYSLILTNEAGQSIDLYDDPEVALMTSDGLDYEGNVTTTTLYGVDGGAYDSTTIPPRNISLTVQYKYTIDDEAAKLRVHDVAVPKSKITITYITPNRMRQITGYCEKCTSPPNAYPMVTTINIVCPDPWWVIPNSPERTEIVPGTVIYAGNIQNGFKTLINILSDTTSIDLKVNEQEFKLRPAREQPFNWFDPLNGGMADNKYLPAYYRAGSRIEIDSRIGYKSVFYYGPPQNSERFVDTLPSYLFPVLEPGANNISIVSDGSFTATVKFTEKYRG